MSMFILGWAAGSKGVPDGNVSKDILNPPGCAYFFLAFAAALGALAGFTAAAAASAFFCLV